MGKFNEYDQYDAMGLAALVSKGEVSAGELLEEAIERTETVNPQINAVVLKHYDEAKEAIAKGLPQGAFQGVPFLLKDLEMPMQGTETTSGSAFFKGSVAAKDSTLVARYKQSGLVIFGKTNSPELGLNPVTEPISHGPTRNPWDLERTPGGSSGGAGAAVAAGILPVASASDGGGSIRIPASCTGLFGLKPTRGRTPVGPDISEAWAGQAIPHVISRSVRDSAALLDATAGDEFGIPYSAPCYSGSFEQAASSSPGKLRVAVARDKWGMGSYSVETLTAVERSAKLLADLGHEVEYAEPGLDMDALMQATFTIIATNTAIIIKNREQQLGRKVTAGEIEPGTQLMLDFAAQFTAEDYARAVACNQQAGKIMGDFHQQYDIVLSSTLSQEPVPIGYMEQEQLDDIPQLLRFMGDTALFNQTGQPSMSVPLHWSENNLPVGSMFTAAFGNDALLISLAAQLEQASPWWDRRAPLYAK